MESKNANESNFSIKLNNFIASKKMNVFTENYFSKF